MISTQDIFSIGQKLKIQILELDHEHPMDVEVRWAQPWGQIHGRMPGVGLQFTHITDAQQIRLNQLLGVTSSKTDFETILETLASDY